MLAALAAGAAATYHFFAGRFGAVAPAPSFTRLTFRRGWVGAARFAPDGQTIVYSAEWDGAPSEVFSLRLGRPESQRVGPAPAELLAVSSTSFVALNRESLFRSSPWWYAGTLARMPLSGGSPLDLDRDVTFADWSPDGKSLAIVRRTDAQVDHLEYPQGTNLFSAIAIICPRISPAGDVVAFADPVQSSMDHAVAVVDRRGRKTLLTKSFPGGISGLAWSPDGKEIWFTAAGYGAGPRRDLRAVTMGGRERVLFSESGSLRLLDVARDGRVLVAREDSRSRAFFHGAGHTADRELSWLDHSQADDLSRDGRMAVINELGEGGGVDGQVYLRDTAGKPPTYLGPGGGFFSTNETFVVALTVEPQTIVLYPVEPGQPQQTVRAEGIDLAGVWGLLPDDRTLVLSGSESSGGSGPPHAQRIWLMDRNGSTLRAISPEGVWPIRPRPLRLRDRSLSALTA